VAPVWGGVFTHFKDLDGNSFSLVSFDDVTRAIEAQRRAAAERDEAERRVAQELDIAKQVQARLFPQDLPVLRTLEYAGICQQARQVGGDYYDFLATGRERLCLVIGDVAGKGIGAALLMANLQANLRSQCAMGLDEPAQLMQSVNRLFCENTPENAYATFFFSEYNDQTGRLRYANCGHLPALIVRAGGELERLESTATVLGRFPCWECSIGETSLFAGDTLALYTDGVTEPGSADGEEFGEQRLLNCLELHRDLSSSDMVSAVIDEVRRYAPHEQLDDITLIVAKCRFDPSGDQMGFLMNGPPELHQAPQGQTLARNGFRRSVAISSKPTYGQNNLRFAESRFPKSLTKREIKCLNARIEELDFEGSVYDWTFLPDDLIEPGLPNFTGAVRGSVSSAIFPGSGALQGHLKVNGLSVLRRS
jgi:serine phosphatase RsbU (regulator of sigma subunit)